MIRRLLALAVLAAWSGVGLCDPPKLNIPAEVKAVGDYVTVAPETTAKAVTFIGLSGVDPFPSDLLKNPTTFVLPVRGLAAGRYRFAAVGSLNDEHAKAVFVVIVGNAPPVPDPVNPDVPPGPTPPAPDPLGLIKASRDGAAKLSGPNKVAEAKALASASRSLASAIAAGGIQPNPAVIMEEWRRANRAAVPDASAAAAWNNSWGAPVSATLQKLHAAGKLPDKASWVSAFNSIASGLE